MAEIKRGPTDYLAETILAYIRENAELRAANDRLLSQLPENQIERLNAALKESQTGSGRTAVRAPFPYPPVGPDELKNCHSFEVVRVVATKNHVFGLTRDNCWIEFKPLENLTLGRTVGAKA